MSTDVRNATASAGAGPRHSVALAPTADRISWKVLLPTFAVLAMLGAALGLLSQDWRQALNLVSKVLIVIAVVLGLLAALQLVRNRRVVRSAVARHDASTVARSDAGLETDGAGAGIIDDAVEISAVEVTAAGAGAVSPTSERSVMSGAPGPTSVPDVEPVRVATAMDVAPLEPRTEVLDAIAPYAEVVGQPVFYEDPAAPVVAAPVATAPAASASAVPPPPPPRPTGRTVPPPPPPAPAVAAMPAVPAPVPTEAPAAPAVAAAVPSTPASPTVPSVPAPVAGQAVDEPVVGGVAGAEPAMVETELVLPEHGDAMVPSTDVPGWSRSSAFPAARGAAVPLATGASAEMAARSAVGSVAPVIVYRYRKWVLGQMVPGAPFEPVAVDRTPDEWLLLSTCGVATLMAWTHEDHHFTYPVETWADEILPAHGVRIRDRQLAVDLLLAAALHAGGIDAVPSDRLRAYQPGDLVTAMASIHVGLLRLYCGLGRIGPERVLADQYGIGPGDIPLH